MPTRANVETRTRVTPVILGVDPCINFLRLLANLEVIIIQLSECALNFVHTGAWWLPGSAVPSRVLEIAQKARDIKDAP